MKPLIILTITGILTLYAGFFKNKKLLAPLAIIGLLVALVFTLLLWNHPASYYHDMMHNDNFSIAISVSLICTTILIFLFSNHYFAGVEKNLAEIYALMIFSLIGAIVMVGFSNVAVLFIGIETMSIPLYILAGSKRFSVRANEASFKYFILGSFSTAIFLLGIAFVYGASGTFNIHEIAEYIKTHNGTIPTMFYIGLLFIIVSFVFKVGAAPFHFWVPDVYEGSPTLTTAFMSTVVKIASIAAFYRFFSISFIELIPFWQHTIWIVIVCTLIIGNLGAINQQGFKRMMAYSGIAHTAFLLLPIITLNSLSAPSILYYSIAYSAATIAAFGVFMLVKNTVHGAGNIDELNGLSSSNPWLAFFMAVSMFSLAGIPIAAGFFAKLYVLSTAIQSGYLWLSIIAIIGAIIAVYYYLQIIIAMYFKKGIIQKVSFDLFYKTSLIISLIITIILGVFPALIMSLSL